MDLHHNGYCYQKVLLHLIALLSLHHVLRCLEKTDLKTRKQVLSSSSRTVSLRNRLAANMTEIVIVRLASLAAN